LHPLSLAKRGTVFLFLAFIALYFYGLGHLPLLGPDEPRYAQVAREMFLRHDLITPTLGGQLWFEKPALLYWLMIACFKLFGVSEFAARLPAAISGLLTIAAVFVVARQIARGTEDREGFIFWSVLAAGTMLGVIVFSRAASFDILLTMTTTWALAFFILHEFESNLKMRRALLAGCYVFIGVSLLGKGLIGIVIPVGVVALYFLLERRLPQRSLLMSLMWGVPLALIVASVWYFPVIQRHGWLFIDQFFIQHHFARYLSNKFHHHAPFYYYLLILPLLALPWTAFLIDGAMESCKSLVVQRDKLKFVGHKFKSRKLGSGDDPIRRLLVFALAWILFPLIFFSLSSSKLPGYLLPVLPAIALIVGERFWRLASTAKDSGADTVRKWPILTTAISCLLLAMFVLIYSLRTGALPAGYWVPIVVLLLVAGSLPFVLRRDAAPPLLCFGATTMVILIVGLNFAPALAERESAKRLLQLADARGYSEAPLFGVQRDDRSPEFYAAGRVVYAPDGEPVMYEGLGQIVWESRRRKAMILTMVPLKDVRQFTELNSMRVDVVGDNGKFALLAVSPP
jgi:4-amino-4-deoxy-L-arabinose transferase-like glycosyltransferase